MTFLPAFRSSARRLMAPLVVSILIDSGLLNSAVAQQRPIPVRELSSSLTTDSGVLSNIWSFRALSNGRALVSDAVQHKVFLLDHAQQVIAVVLDNDGAGPKFGNNLGALIPYRDDSTFFVDMQSSALVLIDPAGHVARSAAAPNSKDYRYLILRFDAANAGVGFDPLGRLVYRVLRRPTMSSTTTASEYGAIRLSNLNDTAVIVRGDLTRRSVDSIARIQVPANRTFTMTTSSGGFAGEDLINPIVSADEWTLLSDGTVAIVRSHDYHIDWLAPDGKITSSPKLPFDWRRITLEEKERMIDSAKAVQEANRAKRPMMPGEPARVRVPLLAVSPSEMPDYYPPLRPGQVKADPAGNVWILPSTSLLASTNGKGGLVFDVVNRKGELFERVRLPKGRGLVGLGVGGIVYMYYQAAPGDVRLERARVMR